MADDTRHFDATATEPSAASDQPPKKFPKGVVLGKDGKPCRTCTSFASWAAQTKEKTKHDADAAHSPAAIATATATPRTLPADCPPDVEQLGRSTWTLLHSIAATYPEQPSRGQQSDLLGFVGLFSRLYPCWVCAEDFRGYIRREVPRVGSRREFSQWLCAAHNDVNRKLGKPEFDCSRWDERWRTGWKDGRCD
ncbi:FAD-linked sulfhydryl oxidase ALR [Escovopsis weberi]|uniref:Sulfhydryl oxidase n=1 Tax=Escovopsis weberi TaxID=150374 RepID=A0A0M9VSF2_ESCWE|nr:FAD-linked sulfhydryl oxidase ALR [Escovopsis weberi]